MQISLLCPWFFTHCHMHSCAQVTPTTLVLHYYNQRAVLPWTWVEGAVDEVAKQIFGVQVHVERLREWDAAECDHEVGMHGEGILRCWGDQR